MSQHRTARTLATRTWPELSLKPESEHVFAAYLDRSCKSALRGGWIPSLDDGLYLNCFLKFLIFELLELMQPELSLSLKPEPEHIFAYLDRSCKCALRGGWIPSLDDGLWLEDMSELPKELPDVMEDTELVRFRGTFWASERLIFPCKNNNNFFFQMDI